MDCLYCRTGNRSDAKFCKGCGKALVRNEVFPAIGSTEQTLICNACGMPNKPMAKFCFSCGAGLAGAVNLKTLSPQRIKGPGSHQSARLAFSDFAKQIHSQLSWTISSCAAPLELLQLNQHRQAALKLAIKVRLIARQLLQLIGLQPLTQRLILDGLMVAGFFFLGMAQE